MGAKTTIRPRRYALAFILLLWGLTLAVYVTPPDLYAQYVVDTDQAPPTANNVEGVYEATATILALVSFGSVLGVRLSTNKDTAGRQLGGLILVSGGSLLVIIIQVLVMGGLCCGSLPTSQYLAYIVLTGLALMAIVGGYATIVIAQNTAASSRMVRAKRAKSTVNKTASKKPKPGRPKKSGTGQPNAGKPSTKPQAKARRRSSGNTSKGR